MGADSPETYDEAMDRAIAEIDAKPPLLIRIVGWPLIAAGFIVMSVGYVPYWLGSKLAGRRA